MAVERFTARTLSEFWNPSRDGESSEDHQKRVKAYTLTLSRWRATGTGPKFMKIGKQILYRKEDIDAYERKNTHESTASYGGR